MNCLVFSIKYKRKHKHVKLSVENHFFNLIKKHGFSKSIFRFFRSLGFVNSFIVIFEPHFYIIDNGFRLDANPRSKLLRYTKIKIGYEYFYDINTYYEQILNE